MAYSTRCFPFWLHFVISKCLHSGRARQTRKQWRNGISRLSSKILCVILLNCTPAVTLLALVHWNWLHISGSQRISRNAWTSWPEGSQGEHLLPSSNFQHMFPSQPNLHCSFALNGLYFHDSGICFFPAFNAFRDTLEFLARRVKMEHWDQRYTFL